MLKATDKGLSNPASDLISGKNNPSAFDVRPPRLPIGYLKL